MQSKKVVDTNKNNKSYTGIHNDHPPLQTPILTEVKQEVQITLMNGEKPANIKNSFLDLEGASAPQFLL